MGDRVTDGGNQAGSINNNVADGNTGKGVQHVVQMTFLGVAGILGVPPNPITALSSNKALPSTATSSSGTTPPTPSSNHSTPPTQSISSSTSSSVVQKNHQQTPLIFPHPSRLRVVASVSRSRTTRGIPSGMSKCLLQSQPYPFAGAASSSSNPKPVFNSDSEYASPPPPILSPSSSTSLHQGAGRRTPLPEDQIMNRLHNTDLRENTTKGTNDPDGHVNNIVRKQSSAKSGHGGEITNSSSFFMKLDENEQSIEVRSWEAVTPKGGERGERKPNQAPPAQSGSKMSSTNVKRTHSGIKTAVPAVDTDNTAWGRGPSLTNTTTKNTLQKVKDIPVGENSAAFHGPKRYVAVWDQGADNYYSKRGPSSHQSQKQCNVEVTEETGQCHKVKHQVVTAGNELIPNFSNSIAFEVDLHSSSTPSNSGSASGRYTSTASFAPKTFCVTIGLVPDFDIPTSFVVDPADGCAGGSRGETDGKNAATLQSSMSQAKLPAFAIPIGFATLAINGRETLDGKRLQLDLPLTSLNKFTGSFSGENKKMYDGLAPLIDLTPNSTEKSKSKDKALSSGLKDASKIPPQKNRIKKKNIFQHMFGRTKQTSNKINAESSPHALTEKSTALAAPCSIFDLGRPPNALERSCFLERYGIDPAGDAVVRICLEVFPRGSELEKIIRQKHKKQRKAYAAVETNRQNSTVGGRSVNMQTRVKSSPRRTTDSLSVPTLGTNRSNGTPSLVDDDMELLDSDYDDDSEYSQSYFSLCSSESGSTWEEYTLITDGGETFNTYSTYDSMADSYTAQNSRSGKFTSSFISKRSKECSDARSPKEVLERMFDCKVDDVSPLKDGVLKNMSALPGASALTKDLVSYSKNHPLESPKSKNALLGLTDLFNCHGSQENVDGVETDSCVVDSKSSVVDSKSSVVSDSTPMANSKQQKPQDLKNFTETKSKQSGLYVLAEIGKEIVLNDEKVTLSSFNSSFPMEERKATNQVEESPLATIKQRTVQHVSTKKSNYELNQDVEGLEITLEELSQC